MGASSILFKVKTGTNLDQWYRDAVDQALYEYGHDAYNGTISTTRGIKTSNKVFTDLEEAEDYILDNTAKWGSVLAVKVKEEGKEEYWVVGGWAAE